MIFLILTCGVISTLVRDNNNFYNKRKRSDKEHYNLIVYSFVYSTKKKKNVIDTRLIIYATI